MKASVAPLSSKYEYTHVLMCVLYRSLQGLITQVESSTASLGKLQTEVHSKNDQSLVQREQLVKYKEEQLAGEHTPFVPVLVVQYYCR